MTRWLLVVVACSLVLMAALITYVYGPVFATPAAQPRVSVDAARLERDVRMLSEQLAPRDHSAPGSLVRSANYIRDQFKEAGGTVSTQAFRVGPREYSNVIAEFGPDTRERIVIGAHYDTCGALPGADDNASGVAGLMELGRLLSKTTLPMRVELVADSLEEPPFFRTEYMGSAIHARSLKARNAAVRLMVSLEMIGYFSDASSSQQFPLPLMSALYSDRANFIAVVGRFQDGSLVRNFKRSMMEAAPLPVHSINAPSFVMGVDFSDHLNYWAEGYPAVMVTDTSFYRNTAYHTAEDTADRLDYRKMSWVVAGVHAAVMAAAGH